MSGSTARSGNPVPFRSGWEGQLGRRVIYHSQLASVVHADLFRLVLRTEEDAPRRLVVDESEWAEVELLDGEHGDTADGEAAWKC